ncbi:Exostoses (Multiple)-like 3, partial [Irineochytrium annulatum]
MVMGSLWSHCLQGLGVGVTKAAAAGGVGIIASDGDTRGVGRLGGGGSLVDQSGASRRGSGIRLGELKGNGLAAVGATGKGKGSALAAVAPTTTTANNRYTYITLLCDELMLDGLLVLAHSLRKVHSAYPLTVMLLPEVSSPELLESLRDPAHGIESVLEIPELAYPFKVTTKMEGENKMCRYSKLNLWNLTQWDKVVFLDADLLVMKNLDQLFEFSEIAAAMDLVGTFNTGVFVAKPDENTFKDMLSVYMTAPSYNKGDQGFLNWYFTERRATQSITALPAEYNVPCKMQEYAIWSTLKRQALIFHYTSATKPWNFYRISDRHWARNMEPDVFWRWVRARREIDSTIGSTVSSDLREHPKEFRDRLQALEQKLVPKWKNRQRVRRLCDANRWEKPDHGTDILAKFTVAIATWDRIDLVIMLLDHYAAMPEVDLIVITWHDPSRDVPESLASRADLVAFDDEMPNRKTFWTALTPGAVGDAGQQQLLREDQRPPIVIVRQRSDSLNNRFNLYGIVRTQAVYIADDDIRIAREHVETGFREWRERPDQLVGFFPRGHS